MAVNRKNIWRKRQIILPEELVTKLFEWHGGQFTAVYALASSGMRDLVSLSMIDAAIPELERDKKKIKGKDRKHLNETVGELELVRAYWKEHSAQESGMGMEESEYQYDHQDYGMDADEEAEIKVTTG